MDLPVNPLIKKNRLIKLSGSKKRNYPHAKEVSYLEDALCYSEIF